MNVDLPLIQSYWENVKVVKVADNASSQDILEAVFSAFSDETATDQLAFDDGGFPSASAPNGSAPKPSADGRVPRHACITPITSAAEQTHGAIVRYLDQNDIVIKDILAGASEAITATVQPGLMADVRPHRRHQPEGPAGIIRPNLMGFHYSPNTSISFPYAGHPGPGPVQPALFRQRQGNPYRFRRPLRRCGERHQGDGA
jgi:hypothetical protein